MLEKSLFKNLGFLEKPKKISKVQILVFCF